MTTQRAAVKKAIQDAAARTNTRRKLMDKAFTGITIACIALALIPLGIILL
jgi:hypothetical protein